MFQVCSLSQLPFLISCLLGTTVCRCRHCRYGEDRLSHQKWLTEEQENNTFTSYNRQTYTTSSFVFHLPRKLYLYQSKKSRNRAKAVPSGGTTLNPTGNPNITKSMDQQHYVVEDTLTLPESTTDSI